MSRYSDMSAFQSDKPLAQRFLISVAENSETLWETPVRAFTVGNFLEVARMDLRRSWRSEAVSWLTGWLPHFGGDRAGPSKSWRFRPGPRRTSGWQGDPSVPSGRGHSASSLPGEMDKPLDHGALHPRSCSHNSTSTNATQSTLGDRGFVVTYGFVLKPAGAALVEVLLTQSAATGFSAMAAATINDAAVVHEVVRKVLTMEITQGPLRGLDLAAAARYAQPSLSNLKASPRAELSVRIALEVGETPQSRGCAQEPAAEQRLGACCADGAEAPAGAHTCYRRRRLARGSGGASGSRDHSSAQGLHQAHAGLCGGYREQRSALNSTPGGATLLACTLSCCTLLPCAHRSVHRTDDAPGSPHYDRRLRRSVQ